MSTTIEQMKQLIVDKVNASTGIRYTELITEVWQELLNNDKPAENLSADDFHRLVDTMLKEGQVSGIEYEVPMMSYRTKMILFPAGTTLRIVTLH